MIDLGSLLSRLGWDRNGEDGSSAANGGRTTERTADPPAEPMAGESPATDGEAPPSPPDRPLPDLAEAPYARPFWEAAADERLLLQYCPACDRYQYFPRPWCARCADDVAWREASGRGTVYSYTVVREVVANPAMADVVPYATAYVELAEGPRMHSRLVDCDVDDVERGLPVEVVFDHVDEDVTLPTFRPR